MATKWIKSTLRKIKSKGASKAVSVKGFWRKTNKGKKLSPSGKFR